jgi:hypothetical protein
MTTAPSPSPPTRLCKDITRKSKFTPEEDAQLTDLVKTYGDDDWVTIACLMPSRTPRQCRERWNHYLTPTISSTPFTREEDLLLLTKYRELGPKWKTIAASFQGRTDINIKNRWLLLSRRHRRAEAALDDIAAPRTKASSPLTIPMIQQTSAPPIVEIPWSSEDDEKEEESVGKTLADSANELTGDYFCLNFACWE